MENIPSLYNYLEKYSIFYLSKYIVTKKKFEIILIRKIQRDLLRKKINYNQSMECRKNISKLIRKFVDLNIINEERQLTVRLDSLISKGFSIKKIFFMLSKDLFSKELIHREIEKLKSKKDFELTLIHNFCKKKKLFTDKNIFQFKNKKDYNKILEKLVREGFEISHCINFLNHTNK